MITESTIPVVPAYHRNQSYYVWCEGCFRWHIHGAGNGSRVAHCRVDTLYRETQYDLQYAGEFTSQIEQEHGAIPADLQPLSNEQVRILQMVYSEVCHAGQRGRNAWRLFNALDLNHAASSILGDHLPARVTYLRWQLARTPDVRIMRKATPWRFLIEQEKPLIFNLPELMDTVFPDDRRVVEVWVHEAMDIGVEGTYTPVWWDWSRFKGWMHAKGPDYNTSRADWLKDLGDQGILPRKIADYGGQVFADCKLKGNESFYK